MSLLAMIDVLRHDHLLYLARRQSGQAVNSNLKLIVLRKDGVICRFRG